MKVSTRAIFGLAAVVTAQQCIVERGVGYSDNDIGSTQQSDPVNCCADCQATLGCKVYTWVDGVCYLKSEQGESSDIVGAFSGTLPSQPEPTDDPTNEPSEEPTEEPSDEPTDEPTEEPSEEPSDDPTEEPSEEPSDDPTEEPTDEPTEEPTAEPTPAPTPAPTAWPMGAIAIGVDRKHCLEASHFVHDYPVSAKCNGSPEQQWKWINSLYLYNAATKQCLDREGNQSGTNVRSFPCSWAESAQWLVAKGNHPIAPKSPTLCLAAGSKSATLTDCKKVDDSQVADVSLVTSHPYIPPTFSPSAPSYSGQLFIGATQILCFEADPSKLILVAAVCNATRPSQRWTWLRSTKVLQNAETDNWLSVDLRGNQMVSVSSASLCTGFIAPLTAGNQYRETICDPEDDLQVFSFGGPIV
ncbi:Aste57867_15090 [Aphanomyces stellatus]|uniref:Aste57867_15090 protein n=1 Tax=Aphanomyces stellatus TaxID=120398 RepID=A0A485L2L5_9STRA|nr:hypothetical protein As57867_015034 [Aphanomyces stellatus]VFT91903.1 Aste57867_15090 [Aphanomyces stellatus]